MKTKSFDWSGKNLSLEDKSFERYVKTRSKPEKVENKITRKVIYDFEWKTSYELGWKELKRDEQYAVDEYNRSEESFLEFNKFLRLFKIADAKCNPHISYGNIWRLNQYKNEWREAVLKDWNNECAVCGETENLHAHHLNNRKDYPNEAEDPDNGIILCVDCHHAFHRSLGGFKVSCTKDDFQRWFEGDF